MARSKSDLESLLATLGPADRLQSFVDARLGPVREYDQAHKGRLIETLTAYFASGRSLAGTAQRLRTHRNTVLYRLRRVEQLAGIDLSDPQTELELQVALHIAAALSR